MSQTYAIIGDSHECVEELSRLVARIEEDEPWAIIVYVGDYLDKGKRTRAMVEYMHGRATAYGDIFLRGNHESFVYGRLEGIISALEDPVKEREVFGSQEVLLENPDLAAKFHYIYEGSMPYLVMEKYLAEGKVPVGYVTHAPCLVEHLGQYDPKSIRAQRNYRTIDRSIPAVEDLKWFYDDADADPEKKLHIFGHMAHSGRTLAECTYKNKVFIDTGCVYGNGLSAVLVEDGEVLDYYFEPSIGSRQPGYSLPPPLGLR